MRKIRLSDTDIEFFDLEVSPTEFLFFQKHKDAFRCMWKEQGKPFWTKFTITFQSFTVKHGVIKQMSCDTPKFENLLDQAFIYIHEQFVDGKEATARSFIDECAKLAQNHDKFPHLDSKSFTKDPFYSRDTRDLFRRFFGSPDQKSSYVKVYVLSPIYLRFGGSVCRCLKKWMDAPSQDCKDESYWIPPSPKPEIEDSSTTKAPVLMCTNCLDDCGTRYFKERICGKIDGPQFLDYWKLGDPRFNDPDNPLYNKKADRESDWRDRLSPEDFRDFIHFAKFKYGTDEEKCRDCLSLVDKEDGYVTNVNQKRDNEKKKKKKKKKKDKEEIAREKRKDEVEEEVQRIIDHITGKNPQEDMPPVLRVRTDTAVIETLCPAGSTSNENTVINVNSITMAPEATIQNILKNKKILFGVDTKRSDDVKFGIMGSGDNARGVVGGFRVIKLEDEVNNAKEIKISVNAVDCFPDDDDNKDVDKSETTDTTEGKLSKFSAELIKSKIKNLPDKMEWWEGVGWCACVLNYEVEEKEVCANFTNFTIKINGKNEMSIKQVMCKLLIYVSNRKNRPSPGWMMDDDDVVASILPEEIPKEDGIIITLQQGFRFEQRLSEKELKTMSRGRSSIFRDDSTSEGPMCFFVQPEGMKGKERVLMALDGGVANAIAKGEHGPTNFKKLLTRISGHCINDKFGYGTPNYPHATKPDNPDGQVPDPYDLAINRTPLWDHVLLSPRTFELLFMVNKDREEELKEFGLRTVDPENVPGKGRDKQPPLQPFCKTCKKEVFDCTCIDKSRFSQPLACNCTSCRKRGGQKEDKTKTEVIPGMEVSRFHKTNPTLDSPTVAKTTPSKESPVATITKITVTNDSPKVTKSSPTKPSPTKDTTTAKKTSKSKDMPSSGQKSKTTEDKGDFIITEVSRDKDARPEPVTTQELEHGFDLMEKRLKEGRRLKEEAKKELEKKKEEEEGKKKETKKSPLGKRASESDVPPKPAMPKIHQFTHMPQSLEKPLEQILKGGMEGVFKFTAVRNQDGGAASNQPVNFIVENVTPPNPPTDTGKKKDNAPKMSEEEKSAKRKEIAKKIAEVRRNEKAEEIKKQQKLDDIKQHEKLAEKRKQEKKNTESSKLPHFEDDEKNSLEKVLYDFKFKPKEELSDEKTKDSSNASSADDRMRETMMDVIKAGLRGDEEESSRKLKKMFHECLENQLDAEDSKILNNLKSCANCQKVEPRSKAYKKCLKCKEQKVKNARYYCGRECQATDWIQRHKKEHKENRLD